jgi:hypothetical protein
MKCVACSKELNKKDVIFTEDKQPYCSNPFTCNEHHPNSVTNIVKRGGAVKMFTEDELENSIFDRLQVSNEVKERVIKIANKPQSIRLSKYEIAYYLLMLQESKGLASISESVRYCVNIAMTQEPIAGVSPVDTLESSDAVDQSSAYPNFNNIVEETKGVHGALTGIVVPDIPKSVNVDWDKVPVPTPAQAEIKEDEDEMTF